VVDEEGCPILDEDNKLGLFPFCIVDTEQDPIEIGFESWDPYRYKLYKVGFSLRDLSQFYWNFKQWGTIKGEFQLAPGPSYCEKINGKICKQNIYSSPIPKERVCLDIGYALHTSLRTNTYLDDYRNVPPCSIAGFSFFGLTASPPYVSCYRYNDLYYPAIYAEMFGLISEVGPGGVEGGGRVEYFTNFNFTISKNSPSYSIPLYRLRWEDTPNECSIASATITVADPQSFVE
jgi:hypothetical protein